jgi:hypothetical protein
MALDIVITNTPDAEFPAETDQNLSFWIEIEEWEKLYLTDLKIPEPERREAEDGDNYLKRWERSFKKLMAKKGYPLLGHIWHYNRDIFYPADEIGELVRECSKLLPTIESELGRSALNKLMCACEEALKVESGIWLVAD